MLFDVISHNDLKLEVVTSSSNPLPSTTLIGGRSPNRSRTLDACVQHGGVRELLGSLAFISITKYASMIFLHLSEIARQPEGEQPLHHRL